MAMDARDSNGETGPALSGSLTAFAPTAILSLLNLQKASGVLHLDNHGLAGTISVQAGEVWDATLGRDRGLPALFYALSWTGGHFAFHPGPVTTRSIQLSLPVIQVRAALWMDRWRQLDRVFPSLWHQIGVHPQPAGDVVIQPHQWPVLTRIVSQPISLIELAALLDMDVMALARIATELVNVGLAVVLPPERDEV